MQRAWWLLISALATGCMEHQLHPTAQPDDPSQYQAVVLDFMCSRTCEWQDVDTCWEQLEGHWAFCVDGGDRLDPSVVERCMRIIDAADPIGECVYLPEECLLSSVKLGDARDCAAK